MPYINKLIVLFLFTVALNCFSQQAKVDSLLRILSPKQDSVRADQLLRIAQQYLRRDSNQVKKYTLQANSLSKKIGYDRGEVWSYIMLGESATYFSDFDRAMYWYNVASERCKTTKGTEDYAIALGTMKSFVEFDKGNMPQSAQYAMIAVKQAEKALLTKHNHVMQMGLERALFSGCLLLGNIHARQAMATGVQSVNKIEYSKALGYYKRCLAICYQDSVSRKNSFGVLYHNIGCYFKDTKINLDSAIYYFKKEAMMGKVLQRDVDVIAAYYAQASILVDQKQYQLAEQLLQKAIPLRAKIEDPEHLVIIPQLLGRIYTETGRYQQANDILKKALQLAKDKSAKEQERTIIEALYQNYQKQGDYKNALLYLEKTNTLKDSLYNKSKTDAINELSIKYETEKKEQEIALLETEKKQKNYWIIGLWLGLIVLIFAIWSKYQSARLEKQLMIQTATTQQHLTDKLQLEMDSKNRVLALQGLYLDQRKSILQDVKKILLGIESNLVEKQTILREIDTTLQFENDWHNFRSNFEQTNPEFFQKLINKSPTLTDLELKHSVYIKLDMTTKQVAQILNIGPDSVSMARVRLKKKLGLGTDESLQHFIQQI